MHRHSSLLIKLVVFPISIESVNYYGSSSMKWRDRVDTTAHSTAWGLKMGFNFQLFSSLHAWLRSWLNVIDTSRLRVKFTDSHNLCERWDQSPLMLSGCAPRDISSSITHSAKRKTVRARERTVNDLLDASIVFPSVATLLICQRASTYFRRLHIIVAANRNDLICGIGGRDGNRSASSLHAVCVSKLSVWVWGGKTFVCPTACEQCSV